MIKKVDGRELSEVLVLSLPVLHIANQFSLGQYSYDNVEMLRIKLLKRLEKIETSFNKHESIRFALVAWLDEAVLHSQWSEKDAWEKYPLARLLFNEHNAGESFYSRLNQCEQYSDNRESQICLSVYYLCLECGFKGKYYMREEDSLVALVHRLRQELIQQKLTRKPKQCALGVFSQSTNEVKQQSHGVKLFWMIGASIVIGMLLGWDIHHQTVQLSMQINSL